MEAEVSCVLAAFSSAIADRLCTVSTILFLASSIFCVCSSMDTIPWMDKLTPSCICSKTSAVFFTFSFCSCMISFTSSIVCTAVSESFSSSRIISSIRLADSLDCSASFWICAATTAKPFPASPALAASMEALSDSRLVSSAMEAISDVASLIFKAESFVVLVCS